jgi:hypothetical protein
MRKRRVYFTQNRREEKWTATYLENASLHALKKVTPQKKSSKFILTSRNQSPKINKNIIEQNI